MSDEITLTLPADRDFHRVAHLVLGGLAVRLNLTFENLEDLQLALDGLLDRTDENEDVTVSVRVECGTIATSVGPFRGGAVRRELESSGTDDVGLRRVLETVADGFRLAERDGADWVEIEKRIRAEQEG